MNMKRIDASSWEDFEIQLNQLLSKRDHLEKNSTLHVIKPIYRGQANSDWPLSTTLERFLGYNCSLKEYYLKILAAKPQIETFTKQNWNIPTLEKFRLWLEKADTEIIYDFPAYEYMIYLRHYGFPSPLLDWTRSYYIAAHFAFNEIDPSAKAVSIFVYFEYFGQAKCVSTYDPFIVNLGPYVKSHERHFLQQSEYTFCINMREQNYTYDSHENALCSEEEIQDIIWQFNIPVSERIKVLKLLDQMNLNPFSLFGNEEGLMRALALKEFLLK